MKNFIFTIFFLLIITGCRNYQPTTLPNGYLTSAETYSSIVHPGSINLRSKENDLMKKSKIIGTISYLGFLNVEDNTLSINNIEQNATAGRGGFLGRGGDGTNNLAVFDNGGVILKVVTSGAINEYIFQLKSNNNELSPAISLKYLKEGDKILIPTIREYENSIDRGGEDGIYAYRWYRILNKIDYIYIHELTTPLSGDTIHINPIF
jgi:hypothetical protein